MLVNLEYLQPVFDRDHIRAVLFMDAGNAYARNSDLDFSAIKLATGLGIRWKIKGFVNLDLSMEYAFNHDSDSDRFYFRTSAPF